MSNDPLLHALSMVTDALPDEARPLVKMLLEGRVKQFILIAELNDGAIASMFPVLQPDANSYTMVGALEVVKRDYMRSQVEARIEYKPLDDGE